MVLLRFWCSSCIQCFPSKLLISPMIDLIYNRLLYQEIFWIILNISQLEVLIHIIQDSQSLMLWIHHTTFIFLQQDKKYSR